jgi:hypothetical protein
MEKRPFIPEHNFILMAEKTSRPIRAQMKKRQDLLDARINRRVRRLNRKWAQSFA